MRNKLIESLAPPLVETHLLVFVAAIRFPVHSDRLVLRPVAVRLHERCAAAFSDQDSFRGTMKQDATGSVLLLSQDK